MLFYGYTFKTLNFSFQISMPSHSLDFHCKCIKIVEDVSKLCLFVFLVTNNMPNSLTFIESGPFQYVPASKPFINVNLSTVFSDHTGVHVSLYPL